MDNHKMLSYYGETARVEVCEKEMHCGDTFQVKIDGKWMDARIERADDRWIVIIYLPEDLRGLDLRETRQAWALDRYEARQL